MKSSDHFRAFLCVCFLFIFAIGFFASCASAPSATNSKKESDISNTKDFLNDTSAGLAIAMPKRGKSYFASIDDDIVALVEAGSPDTIKQALQKIKKENYKENEKVLINIAISFMQLVWPSQHFLTTFFDSVDPPAQNIYTGAVDCAKRGIYDKSTGNTDFLSLVLPSLLLVTVPTKDDFYEDAYMALDTAQKINQNSILLKYLFGVLCYRQATKTGLKTQQGNQKIKQALVFLQQANTLCPDVYEIQKALALCYNAAGNTQDFVSLCTTILIDFPNDTDILKLMAKVAFENNDLDSASEYIAKVLQKESGDLESIRLRAKILMAKGDFIRAATLLDMHARVDKTNVEYLLLRAQMQKDWNKNFNAATSTLQEAVKLYPNDKRVLQAAASLASDIGGTIAGFSSVELADLALQKDPNDINALRIKAQSYIKQKDYQKAFALNNQILKLKDSSNTDLQRQVEICLATGRADEAFNIAYNMYTKDQQSQEAVESYIKVLVSQRKYQQANNIINSLMPQATSQMKSFFYYQKSYFATDEDSVFSALRSSLTANPRNKDALFRMYKVYFDKKDYRKAQYYLKQVVSLDPSDTQMLDLNAQLEKLIKY